MNQTPANARALSALSGTSRYDAVILGGACGRSAASIARELGVNERTVRRYQERPDYDTRVATLRSAMYTAAAGRLLSAVDKAVDALEDVAAHGDTSAARVSASRALLAQTTAFRTETDLEAEIHELREALHRIEREIHQEDR